MLRDPTVKLTRLTTSVIICPVGEHVITCRASENHRVLLNMAADTVAIHEPVECLVISDEEEFILSQDVLKTHGIDINRQLEQLAECKGDDDACLSVHPSLRQLSRISS
ncbi:hypothetical protein DVH05_008597 [Phytophthora capsici]|nr:hypothetical protein DVH05_008597 [Phytophthora capsici]